MVLRELDLNYISKSVEVISEYFKFRNLNLALAGFGVKNSYSWYHYIMNAHFQSDEDVEISTGVVDDNDDSFVPTEPAAQPEQPETSSDDDAIVLSLSDIQRRARWQARRPPIAHLKDAVVCAEIAKNPETGAAVMDSLPLFDVGQRIVVDCSTNFLFGRPWLHTLVGKVRSINDDSGLVSLYDEESDPRNPMVRWVSFKDGLHVFKLAPERGDPFAVRAVKAQLRREAAMAANPTGEKRGRGRPKGSKNRPKEVIKAERDALRALRAEKRKK